MATVLASMRRQLEQRAATGKLRQLPKPVRGLMHLRWAVVCAQSVHPPCTRAMHARVMHVPGGPRVSGLHQQRLPGPGTLP